MGEYGPARRELDDYLGLAAAEVTMVGVRRDGSCEIGQSSIDSNQPDLKKNDDGSVNVYFGPEAPQGKEANWIPTAEGRRFFLLFRFYGPKPAVYDRSFELNDIELID